MHEDLLGYLLGALEPDEMQRVADWLRENPEGQAQLAEIERSLAPFEGSFEPVEAPSQDLIERTRALIPDGVPPQASESPEQPGGTEQLSNTEYSGGKSLSPVLEGATGSAFADTASKQWGWMDSVTSLLSVAVLLSLLLPMVASGRFEARKIACQDQLREFGTALMQYVVRDQDGHFPGVAASGPKAFAGIYALHLSDAGILPDAGQRWCPAADIPDLPPGGHSTTDVVVEDPDSEYSITLYDVPRVDQLQTLSPNELRVVQQWAGGHYAYSLGVVGETGFSSPRYEGRASFAVMSDAPLSGWSTRDGFGSTRYAHGDLGINVLYEDGAVRFIRAEAFDSMPDHPLINHAGVREAGVNIDDASLAPSWLPPFMFSSQR
ncbi:hypothetical protein FYK55_07785 [Roseiconus nitratireducens]|uniref:Uncharacterized protein n=1 Tax=Roseiconus nitratireducens TaxID=2605748 RepID=A0A5M6DH01_9BACT|nr:hypothetical protein [Roseiconus nitratireducens]KAA5545532.1 hypothetical protein FYK55_07785 [Roseiconus nitratireducens]